MNWIKWIFSFMHWKWWAAIAVVLITVPLLWFHPFANTLTAWGLLIGTGWVIFAICALALVFLLLAMPTWELDDSIKNWSESFKSAQSSLVKWWNTRPGER